MSYFILQNVVCCNVCTFYVDYSNFLVVYSAIILPDNCRLPLTVAQFVVLTYLAHPTVHIHDGVAAESDEA